MKPQAWKKKGAILVYVVLIMALLIVFGVGMIFLANHNSNTTANEVYAEQAYLTARSGLRSTMTMMEEDTAKTSDVASQLKKAKTLTSSVDLTANKLGTVSVQVSCTDTDCTILQIDSTGTYQGVSQTVTGYMKSSAPEVTKPLMILNQLKPDTQIDSGNQATVTDFANKQIAADKATIAKWPLGLENYYQSPDINALLKDSNYIVIDLNNSYYIDIFQNANDLEVDTCQYEKSGAKVTKYSGNDLKKIFVFYNYSDSRNGVALYSTKLTPQKTIMFFADDGGEISFYDYGTMKKDVFNLWLIAPSSSVNIMNKKDLFLTGNLICGELTWRQGKKFTIDGTDQDPTENTAFMNLYNQLAGGGWTRSYEKP